MKKAVLYEKLKEGRVRCCLCAHRCLISEGRRGVCAVRENKDGTLYSLVYAKLISQQVDPIEKKPFFHFFPSTRSYSIATVGCNFSCDFCQNYTISQMVREHKQILGDEVSPRRVVESALEHGCKSISYTYTEPTIAFEYIFEIMKLAKGEGLYNSFVTNGYMTTEMLEYSDGYLDAANIDLKAYSDEFYKRFCGAKLEPVLEAIRMMKKMNIWVEITTLLIPGINDSDEELRKCAEFILGLGKEIPWHISRFYPHYKMDNISPTPVEKLEKAREIGLDLGLRYVYTGNLPTDQGENTYCSNCKKPVIKRYGFEVVEYNLKDDRCIFCKTLLAGRGL